MRQYNNYYHTVGLKEPDISSNDECPPTDMKAEPVNAEIADSVEEISEVILVT